jgi:hypothetical protein
MALRLDVVAAAVAMVGCGRIGFGDRPAGPVGDAAIDAPRDATAAGSTVRWVKSFVDRRVESTTFDQFTAAATTAGDAVLVQLVCEISGGGGGPGVAFGPSGGSGWTSQYVTELEEGSGLLIIAAGMIAGGATPVTFDLTWSDVTCASVTEFGDEFTGNDPTGGATTFGGVYVAGSGGCAVELGVETTGEAVWAGCTGTALTGVGSGLTASVEDANGHWTAWRTGDPAGTTDPITFFSSSMAAPSVLTAVTVAPL